MIIVKRVDERQPLLIPQAHRLGVGVVIHAGHQHHIGSVAAGSLNLRDGRTLGDADGSLDAHIAGSESYALRVVASGAGDDASCFLLVGEGVEVDVVGAPAVFVRVDLVFNAVKTGHQQRRVAEVRVAGGVRLMTGSSTRWASRSISIEIMEKPPSCHRNCRWCKTPHHYT